MNLTLSMKLARYAKSLSGMTSEQFSLKLGYGKNTLRNWENGHSRPCLEDLNIALSAVNKTLMEALRETA